MTEFEESIAQANYAWGEITAHTLSILGVNKVYFSPGSRSTSLVLAFERHPRIECFAVLDERSASFLALGTSKRTQIPTVLLCTSGSAVCNWFPAVVEASHSSIPLLLVSADRPPELQNCGADQTIDQEELFGSYPRAFHQLPLPTSESSDVQQLRLTLTQAFQKAIGSDPGPVHLNFPFREPFVPKFITPPSNLHSLETIVESTIPQKINLKSVGQAIKGYSRVLMIAGQYAFNDSIHHEIGQLRIPILCDSLSPLREKPLPNRILRYENLIRDPIFSQMNLPDLVIVLGPLPTSKILRQWIDSSNAKRIVIEPRGKPVDPLTSPSTSFQIPYQCVHEIPFPLIEDAWLNSWLQAEQKIELKMERAFAKELPLFEGKLARLLSIHSPDDTLIHIANSMPMRDVEWFWKPSSKHRRLFGNRGTNGIDGTLGTAIGIAHQADFPTYLLTGDLAFLHDSNALLFSQQFQGSLTVFVVNNQGGGIFQNLSVTNEPEFEKCFATPQSCNLQILCKSHQIEFIQTNNWKKIISLIEKPITVGIRIVELLCNSRKDKEIRNRLLSINS